MTTPSMVLELMDARSVESLDEVTSFVGEDRTGQFGLWPGHEPVLTVLEPGIFRYRQLATSERWRYVACMGGMLRTIEDKSMPGRMRIQIVSRRFILNDNADALLAQLKRIQQQESQARQWSRGTVEQMDRAMYQRLQELAEGSAR